MKSIKEIEDLGMEDLGRIAADTSIQVPADLEEELRKTVAALSLAEEEKETRRSVAPSWVRPLAAAASLGLLVAAGAAILNTPEELQDTYSDPAVAYAMLEESFGKISSKMSQGIAKAQEAGYEAREITNQALGL